MRSATTARTALLCAAAALALFAAGCGQVAGGGAGGEDGATVQVAAEESAADESLQVAEPAAEDVADGAAPAVGGVPDEAVVTAAELHELLEAPGGVELLVVDIRSYGANALGSVEGALSIPAGSLFELRMDEIPTDADVVLIDADGTRVAEAYGMLEASGAYDMGRVRVVCDGMDAWKEAGFELSERKVRGTC